MRKPNLRGAPIRMNNAALLNCACKLISRLAVVVLAATHLYGATKDVRYQRWLWNFRQRAYPSNSFPATAKEDALKQIEQNRSSKFRGRTPSLIAGQQWINIGPAPITNGQMNPPAPVSGRVTCVAIDPRDTNHWVIGSAMGGVWASYDAGATWAPKSDAEASLAIGAVAFAPSATNIIFAGTGEPNGSDSYSGAGLLKSTNSGASWFLLGTNAFAENCFTAIRVNPTNENYLCAAAVRNYGAFYDHMPKDALPSPGLYVSSNGGSNWVQKLVGQCTAVEVSPTNFSCQYAGVTSGLQRSFDGGINWSPVSIPWNTADGIDRVALAIASSNPNIIYVTTADSYDRLSGVWRTTNGWDSNPSWVRIDDFAIDYDGQWTYGQVLTVHPANPNLLFLGGIDIWIYDGISWTDLTPHGPDYANKGVHVDQHAFAWADNRLIVGSDGGVFSSTDNGDSWSDHNSTLALTQFYHGSVHPWRPNVALGGSQDNGSSKWTGTNSWTRLGADDGTYSDFSPSDPDNNYVVAAENLDMVRFRGTDIVSNVDSGITDQAPFIAPFKICPSDENFLMAGAHRLWASTDFFSSTHPSWFLNGPDLDGNVTAIDFAPSDSTGNTYTFGTDDGRLYITSAGGGANWNEIMQNSVNVPHRWVTSTIFDPSDSNVLYVAFSGFNRNTPGRPGHVFVTLNALDADPTWHDISPPVDLPANCIALDPNDPENIYIGTDIGVWFSPVGETNWYHMGPESGMPNVAVFDLKVNSLGRIIAFTHGRGAFALASTTPPILSISKSGNVRVLSWPALPVNYCLEATPAIGPSLQWAGAGLTPYLFGSEYFATNAGAANTSFYRLKRF